MPGLRGTAALLRVARRMRAIDAMAAGPDKERALADFLVEAEAAGDPDIIVATTVEAYGSAYDSGRWDSGVAALVRLVAAYSRHRGALADMVHRAALDALETTPEMLVLTPTVEAGHLERALTDITGLLLDGGRSDAAVTWGRAIWADQQGDRRAAVQHLDRYLDAGGDTRLDAVVPVAMLLAHLGHEDEADALMAPHRGHRLRRSDMRVGGAVVQALALVARGAHAAAREALGPVAAAIVAGEVTGWQLVDQGEAAALLARLGDGPAAVAAASTALAAHEVRTSDAIDEVELCAHLARVHRDPAGDADLVATLVARAQAAADLFDARNGATARRRWVADVVAAPDLTG